MDLPSISIYMCILIYIYSIYIYVSWWWFHFVYYFHPEPWGNDPIVTCASFSNGWESSTTNLKKKYQHLPKGAVGTPKGL